MIKSRQSVILLPITIVLAICCATLLVFMLIVFMSIIFHTNSLPTLEDWFFFSLMIVIAWLIVLPLVVVVIVNTNYVTHPDKLEVNYLFGLLKYFHDYSDLKLSDYSRRGSKGILIEFAGGDQLTLSESPTTRSDWH
jgi:hypothetical protein